MSKKIIRDCLGMDSNTEQINYHPNPMAKDEQVQSQVSLLMVPFPAQGHLNQLLHLSRLISSNSNNNNIHIHFASTPSHIRQAKLRIHGWNILSTSSLHFHQLPIPSFNSPPPNPDSTTNYPSHLQPSFDATIHLRKPVSALMKSLSSTAQRVVVIYDSLMASVVQDSVLLPKVESYSFHSPSAFFNLLFTWERMGKPFPIPIDEQLLDVIPSMDDCLTPEFQEFLNTQSTHSKLCVGDIYNTCGIVESQFLELLDKKLSQDNRKLWALGPFNPVKITNIDENGRHECLEWLDKQSENSVLYVSFGTTTSMSDKQIKEVAIGLEKSKQKFLWVVRDADKGDVFDGEARRIQLPDGFEENVQRQGLVLRSWAPQLAILGHPATGGFMSHCGWNSCMESITMGVPIAAWPMHSDQPRNAALISHVLKIGVVVRDWESRKQLVTSSMVEEAVRKLMVSEVGGEMRKRAAELGVAVRSSVEKGGDTQKELDSFIAYICR